MSFAKTPLKQNWIIITTFYFEVTKNKNNFNGEYNTWVHVLKKKKIINVLLILKIDFVTHVKKISKILFENTCINYFKY